MTAAGDEVRCKSVGLLLVSREQMCTWYLRTPIERDYREMSQDRRGNRGVFRYTQRTQFRLVILMIISKIPKLLLGLSRTNFIHDCHDSRNLKMIHEFFRARRKVLFCRVSFQFDFWSKKIINDVNILSTLYHRPHILKFNTTPIFIMGRIFWALVGYTAAHAQLNNPSKVYMNVC